jgi:hypothetical protein
MLWLANGVSATLYCSLVTAPTCRFAVYGTKGTVELATPDVEFRFTPVTEPPATSRHRDDLLRISDIRRMSCPIEGIR